MTYYVLYYLPMYLVVIVHCRTDVVQIYQRIMYVFWLCATDSLYKLPGIIY